TIPNERLLHTVQKDSSLADSFGVADDVLRQAVQGISDLITVPGLINLDFADVKSIMEGMGMALMGAGRARGENRAIEATQEAISIASAAGVTSMPANAPRFVPRSSDDLPRPMMQSRADDLDVPTFIRKKAD